MCDYIDILQIGARNMQNFSLLKEVGKVRRPVLLERGMHSTLSEWLNCAEYILSEGNFEVFALTPEFFFELAGKILRLRDFMEKLN